MPRTDGRPVTTETKTHTQWWIYVESLLTITGWTQDRLAEEIEVARSTPGFWKNRDAVPDAATVRKVAHAFGRPVPEALIRAQLVTEDELGYSAPPVDPTTLSNAQLAAEFVRRLNAAGEPLAAPNKPADEADAEPKTATVRRQAARRR